jgi:hypothetical protein
MQGFHLVHIKSSPRWSRQCGEMRNCFLSRSFCSEVSKQEIYHSICKIAKSYAISTVR